MRESTSLTKRLVAMDEMGNTLIDEGSLGAVRSPERRCIREVVGVGGVGGTSSTGSEMRTANIP